MAESGIIQNISEVATVPIRAGNSLRLSCYLAPFVAVPFLIVAMAILIVPTDWFAEHSQDAALVTLGYGAQLRHADCQILIYGDSTAMFGINPEIIRKRTGLSTCNIAENEGMTMVNGTMVPDLYLRHNPRPRFFVFMYAPEALDPQSQRRNPVVTTFEAVTFRFRQSGKLASFFALMRYPEDIFSWSEHGVRWLLRAFRSRPFPAETKLLRFKTMGRVPFGDAGLTGCDYPRHNNPPDRAWVQSLRSKYGRDGTTVLIDSDFLPDCDPDISYFRRELSGVIDNQIDTLPVSEFTWGGRHMNQPGSILLSNMVADQILERMRAHTPMGGP
jgi:hypothetical protein